MSFESKCCLNSRFALNSRILRIRCDVCFRMRRIFDFQRRWILCGVWHHISLNFRKSNFKLLPYLFNIFNISKGKTAKSSEMEEKEKKKKQGTFISFVRRANSIRNSIWMEKKKSRNFLIWFCVAFIYSFCVLLFLLLPVFNKPYFDCEMFSHLFHCSLFQCSLLFDGTFFPCWSIYSLSQTHTENAATIKKCIVFHNNCALKRFEFVI